MPSSTQASLKAADPRKQTYDSVTLTLSGFHLGIVTHAADRSPEALGICAQRPL